MFDGHGELGRLVELERVIAAAHAEQLGLIARLHDGYATWLADRQDATQPTVGSMECTAAEVGAALSLSSVGATARIELALAARRVPASVAALAEGRITLVKLRIVVEHVAPLDDEACARVEAAVLERAARQTPSGLGVALARAVVAADPSAAERRRTEAVRERKVTLYPERDGMAGLYALLPAAEGLRVHEALTAAATIARHGSFVGPGDAGPTDGDDRSMDQCRADALVDLVLSRPGGTGGAGPSRASGTATVHVTVAWTTLAGLDDRGAELAGYGPITAEAAREIAGDATWRRLLTDPVSGAALDVGTMTYSPPDALARHVRARDGTCRFPGCRRAARRCDLDHGVPYPDGPTSVWNLAALCRRHHRIKTHGGWGVAHGPGAELIWTSPLGRRYTTSPAELPRPSAA